MKLEIEEFLEQVDEWKSDLQKDLTDMSPAQRKAFWHRIRAEAKASGLNVVEPEQPSKTPVKRVRRTG
jgi:hypothetical protein